MIKALKKESLQELTDLLTVAKLPVKDLDLSHQQFVGIYDNSKLIGAAALEIYGNDALLRSVVVDGSQRKLGKGKELVKAAEKMASEKGVSRLFLLTETAQDFFSHLGYETVSRDHVPEELKKSSEFSYVCPSSAICMMLNLNK